MSSHHCSTCHPVFFCFVFLRHSTSQGLQTLTQSLTQNIEFDRELHDPPPYPPSGIRQSLSQSRGGRRGGEESCRVEVKWGWKPPAFETVKRLLVEKDLVSGGTRICVFNV